MKKISQIAIECGVDYERVYRTIKNIGMVLDKGYGKRLNRYQEEVLQNALYTSGFTDTITLESKMNIKETFEEFKQRTYGKKQKT